MWRELLKKKKKDSWIYYGVVVARKNSEAPQAKYVKHEMNYISM